MNERCSGCLRSINTLGAFNDKARLVDTFRDAGGGQIVKTIECRECLGLTDDQYWARVEAREPDLALLVDGGLYWLGAVFATYKVDQDIFVIGNTWIWRSSTIYKGSQVAALEEA
jgi:hypothetical protein